MNKFSYIAKLRRLAEDWNGKFVRVNPGTLNQWNREKWTNTTPGHLKTFLKAPFTDYVGIDWVNLILYYEPKANVSAIIHELGHMFASKNSPDNSNEWEFFGWEFFVVKHIRYSTSEWKKWMANYGVPDPTTSAKHNIIPFHMLKPNHQQAIIKERMLFAVQTYRVKNNIPQNVRANAIT